MVCTYFLLANIVVFGFGRKNKHVMPDVYEIEGRIQFLPFFASLEKLVLFIFKNLKHNS